MVPGSKTPAYSHAVQRRKAPHNKYEQIVKHIISVGARRLGNLY